MKSNTGMERMELLPEELLGLAAHYRVIHGELVVGCGSDGLASSTCLVHTKKGPGDKRMAQPSCTTNP